MKTSPDVRKPFFLAVAALALLAPAAPGRAAGLTLYVSGAGNDANNGSQAAPFRQVRRALQFAGAGDTILVGDGSYLGFDVRNKQGTAAAPLLIRAVGTGAVITPTTDRPDNRDTIFVTFSSWVTVDGFRSFNANRAAVRVDQSPRITVRNCVLGNNARWGIFTDFSDDLLLENNECYGSAAEHGIYVSNSGDRPVVRGNRIHDNYASGIQLNADLSAGGDGIISGAVLENNVVWNNGRGGGAALNLDGVQDSVVRNNLLFNNHSTGIVNYRGNGAAGPKNMQIFHNTIDQPTDGRWAVHIGDSVGPLTLRNNILFTRHSYRGSIEYVSGADVDNTDSDYNVLSKVTPDNGNSILSFVQWQSLGHEAHSRNLTLAQLWVNPAAADYHLLAASPAVNAGLTLAVVPVDLEGSARPQGAASDLGCYELPQTGADVTPPAAPTGTTAAAGNATVTVRWTANTEPDLAGYFLYRAEAAAGPFTRQNAGAVSATSLTQTGLVNGKTYWYRVTAVDTTGNESGPGATVSAAPAAPVTLTGLTFNPTTLWSGWTSQGRVTLSGPAPAGGVVVQLRSSSARLSVPTTVTVPAGATSAAFTATAGKIRIRETATVTATYAGGSRQAALTLTR